MNIWIQLVLLVILLSIIFVIITENRNPYKTLAWCLVLIFVPILGLFLYIFVGIDNRHKRLISDAKYEELKANVPEINPEAISKKDLGRYTNLSNIMYSTNLAHVLDGNEVQPYIDCREMYEALLKELEKATDHIHMMFFKFEEDEIGRAIADLMIKKAHEGVKVRFMYDDFANIQVRKRFYKKMADEGIEVRPFARVIIPFISPNSNYRNHRKMVVIDGKVGFVGGMNVAKRYADGIHGGIWRDTHIRISGPAVAELQTAFLVDWSFESGQFLNESRYYPHIEPAGNITMQIATSGPMDKWDNIKHGFAEIISRARRYVYIQSPYLLPTGPILMAIQNAALAGVDVRMMIPIRGDKGILPPLASRSYVSELLKAGVKVYFYDNGYLHSKTIVSDDEFLTIGSTNIDFRSFEQNFEVNAFIYDADMARQMKQVFLDDERYCKVITEENWAKRSVFAKLKESFARLFSPLL